MTGFQRILVICPPHLVPKWKREVEMTVPGVRAAIVESITDLERLRLSVGSGPLFAVMSREKAKLSYRWMPAVVQRWAVSRGRLVREEDAGYANQLLFHEQRELENPRREKDRGGNRADA